MEHGIYGWHAIPLQQYNYTYVKIALDRKFWLDK